MLKPLIESYKHAVSFRNFVSTVVGNLDEIPEEKVFLSGTLLGNGRS